MRCSYLARRVYMTGLCLCHGSELSILTLAHSHRID
jgi:hypothetical protein